VVVDVWCVFVFLFVCLSVCVCGCVFVSWCGCVSVWLWMCCVCVCVCECVAVLHIFVDHTIELFSSLAMFFDRWTCKILKHLFGSKGWVPVLRKNAYKSILESSACP